ncbi:Sodium:sulfate symporter transmembrane region-domain-containing protein [Blastocladiella britannica]|nr:Sodium:sulfate symporter transmembrane region-domain-containing protein [Blastocladiella britannica]
MNQNMDERNSPPIPPVPPPPAAPVRRAVRFSDHVTTQLYTRDTSASPPPLDFGTHRSPRSRGLVPFPALPTTTTASGATRNRGSALTTRKPATFHHHHRHPRSFDGRSEDDDDDDETDQGDTSTSTTNTTTNDDDEHDTVDEEDSDSDSELPAAYAPHLAPLLAGRARPRSHRRSFLSPPPSPGAPVSGAGAAAWPPSPMVGPSPPRTRTRTFSDDSFQSFTSADLTDDDVLAHRPGPTRTTEPVLVTKAAALRDLKSLIPALMAAGALACAPDLAWEPARAAELRLPFRVTAGFLFVAVAVLTSSVGLAILVPATLAVMAVTGTAACPDPNSATGGGQSYTQCTSSHLVIGALFEGYGDPVEWLVFAAFQLGLAVQHTGLGERVCGALLKWTGRRFSSVLALSYAVIACEYLLALMIPSNTARGAGIIAPIISALITASAGSPAAITAPKAFENYWLLLGSHANILSASAHMSGMAAGPLIARMLRMRLGVNIGYLQWTLGALAPAVSVGIALPPLLGWWTGCQLRARVDNCGGEDPANDEYVDEEVGLGGDPPLLSASSALSASSSVSALSDLMTESSARPWTFAETSVVATLAVCLALWIGSSLDPAAPALLAVVVLMLVRALPLPLVLAHVSAWDAFLWLGGFLSLSAQLEHVGATAALGTAIGKVLPANAALAVPVAVGIACGTMIGFSSLTSHAVVVGPPLMGAIRHAVGNTSVNWASGIALAIGMVTGGCLTPYTTGSVVVYAGKSSVPPSSWIRLGCAVAALHLSALALVGSAWWWVLGWW